MEYRALLFKLMAKLIGVYKVAVMSKRHSSFIMINENWLCVESGVCARCTVAHMADRHISESQPFKLLGSENIVHKSRVLI